MGNFPGFLNPSVDISIIAVPRVKSEIADSRISIHTTENVPCVKIAQRDRQFFNVNRMKILVILRIYLWLQPHLTVAYLGFFHFISN